MSIGALGAIAASSRAPATAEAESPADSHLLRTASLPELFVNGRFALQRTTGVQRVAREIVAALDRRLQANRQNLFIVVFLKHLKNKKKFMSTID